MKKNMKIFVGVLLFVAVAVGIFSFSHLNKQEEKVYTVRLSCDTVDDSILTVHLKEFAKEAEKLSNGKLKFEIYTNGSLYKGVAGLEATQHGDLEMCLCALSNYGELSPKIFVLSLPFVFPNNDAVCEAYAGELGQLAVEDIHKYNLEFLSYFVYGGTDISSNKVIKVPNDIKGQQIRAFGLANSSFIKNCGGAPTFMSGGEVTQALSTGLIDGALTGAESMLKRKYYEFQKYLCAVGFERADQMVVMNNEWWQGLPEDVRGYITKAMDKVRKEEWKAAVANEANARNELQKKGMLVYYPTKSELALWYKASDSVYNEFKETLGDELVAKAINFRDTHK